MDSTSPFTHLGTSPLTSPVPSSPSFTSSPPFPKRRRIASSHQSGSTSLSTSSDSESLPNDTPTKPKQAAAREKKPRRRRSEEEKAENMLRLLKEMRWDVKRFLRTLYKHRRQHTFRVAQKHFFDFAYAELPRDPDFERIMKPKKKEPIIEYSSKRTIDALHSELKSLGSHEAFGEFHPPSKDQDLGAIPFIPDATPTIAELAPKWLHLLQRVCSENTSSPNASVIQPATLILATLCHLMRRKKSNNFQTTLGLYLYQGGTRRRVLDTLCRFGLIISYTTMQRRLTSLRVEAEPRVEAVAQAPSTV